MNIAEKIRTKLKEDLSMQGLVKLALLLVIVLLFQATAGIWTGLFNKIFSILKPFIAGFVIAYVLRRFFSRLEEHGISRRISVPVVYLIIILLLIWLLSSLVPMVLSKASALIESMINSINWVREQISMQSSSSIPSWVLAIINSGVETLSDFRSLIPGLTGSIPDVVNAAVGAITTTIISIVVSIFMSLEWDMVRAFVVKTSLRISPRCYKTVFAIDEEIGEYLKSMLTLMMIRFVEYSLLYFLVGHPDWLILGLLTAISIFIPYIGPIAVNTIGILTALTLSTTQILILLAAIAILSQVDEYMIAPLVHARRTHISPLWTLFSIFAGGNLLGVWGIVLAIPVFLALRTVYRIWSGSEEEEGEAKEDTK